MPMSLKDPLQTMAITFQQICSGEDPWVALGNFTNDWFLYAYNRRLELVADPPALHNDITKDKHCWAIFIAASVEYLCEQANLPCPAWVNDPHYQQLDEPWYHVWRIDAEVKSWLEQTTPEPFKKRQIFCGDRVYLDKRAILELPA